MFDQTNQTKKRRMSRGTTSRGDELPARLFEDELEAYDTMPHTSESGEGNDISQMTESTAAKTPKGLLPFRLFDDTPSAPDAKPADGRETLTVKYNGEYLDIPIDEAITLAQKGMNYDHMLAQREREASALTRMAAEAGMSRGEYLSRLEERGAGINPQEEAFRRLLTGYPEIRIEELPAEFFRQVDEGKNPVEVYQQMRIEDLTRRLAAAEKSAENHRRSLGSARGDAQETVRDAFLEGFLGI